MFFSNIRSFKLAVLEIKSKRFERYYRNFSRVVTFKSFTWLFLPQINLYELIKAAPYTLVLCYASTQAYSRLRWLMHLILLSMWTSCCAARCALTGTYDALHNTFEVYFKMGIHSHMRLSFGLSDQFFKFSRTTARSRGTPRLFLITIVHIMLVLLNRYNSPKILPCQHTVCKAPCLEGLIDRLACLNLVNSLRFRKQ